MSKEHSKAQKVVGAIFGIVGLIVSLIAICYGAYLGVVILIENFK